MKRYDLHDYDNWINKASKDDLYKVCSSFTDRIEKYYTKDRIKEIIWEYDYERVFCEMLNRLRAYGVVK